MENNKKRSRKNGVMSRLVFTLLMCFFAAVFAFSLYKVISGLSEYKKADNVYADLRSDFVSVNTAESEDTSDASSIDGAQISVSSDTTATDVETPSKRAPISVDFGALTAYNADIVGWLYCEGTELNYPVVQTSDNDYYLRRDLQGNWLVTGTIFADFRCVKPGVDRNYMIFGHDMDNGTIFGMLKNYAEQAYYDAHPVFWFLTPNADYKIEVYTGVVVHMTDELYRVGNEGEDFTSYVKSLAAGSGVTPAFEITDDDRLMTLSTCSDEYEDARFVLIGKVTEAAHE